MPNPASAAPRTPPRVASRLRGLAIALTLLLVAVACGDTAGDGRVELHVERIGAGGGTVVSTPSGIDCGSGGACSARFLVGSVVDLRATPDEGSALQTWSGCATTDGSSCRVTMQVDRSVSVRFEPTASASLAGTVVYPGTVSPAATSRGGAERTSADAVRGARAPTAHPGELVVRFRAAASPVVSTMQVAGDRLTLASVIDAGGLALYRTSATTLDEALALAALLKARPDVEDAYPNWAVEAFDAPNDPLYPRQWHIPAANLEYAWTIHDGSGQTPIVVAVVDSGVVAHPDLAAAIVAGYDVIDGDTDPTDPGGDGDYHGTHVAGTVAALTDNGLGVAGSARAAARVSPVRVLDGDGVGTFVGVLRGVAWAAGNPLGYAGLPPNPNPARVINLSLGAVVPDGCPADAQALFDAVLAAGVTVVAAAGNSAADAEDTFPAHCDGVLSVGAFGPTGARAPYSNHGTTVDLMAPGGDLGLAILGGDGRYPAGVLSTAAAADGAPAYLSYQGTSMAAPHVAGTIALMLSAQPSLGPAAVYDALTSTAVPMTATECDRPSASSCGAGRLDAAATLAALTGAGPTPPPTLPVVDASVPTYVVAFYCIATPGEPCGGIDLSRSGEVAVPTTSNEVPYQITGLEAGTYQLVAWQDVDGDLDPGEGEPIGFHPSLVPLAAGQSLTGLRIDMEPYQPLATTGQRRSMLDLWLLEWRQREE